ncbi:nSTAND1 domain-containing NTPase [Streptomyces sp. NPDC054770]
MASSWETAIARVLDGDRPEGAAFLVADGYLLTCTHVVAEVAGLTADEALPVGCSAVVDFPLSVQPGPREAQVCFSSPVGADLSGDLAVLKLSGDPPPDVVPLRLADVDGLAGHRWRAFGFPTRSGIGKDAGVWSSGLIEGREATGWWQLRADPDAAFPLAQGFSGGPVWDEELGAVVGIVVTVEADARLRTGYALTVAAVERDWPELRRALLAGNPYRDLSAFTEDDATVFFGREHETRRLVELVERDNTAIVPILGASGVGKSSLVSAGLVSHLLQSGRYLVTRIPHGQRYTAEELLAWALVSPIDDGAQDETSWHARWRALVGRLRDKSELAVAVDRLLAGRPHGTRLLVIADQLEGLLTEAPEVASRLDALLGALTARRADGARAVQAVAVSRTDFLRHMEALPQIAAAWNATQVVIPPMTRDQLREAATRPLAGFGGVRFADGLLERILDDTPAGAAGLPLLEFTLDRLWQHQRRGELTARSYHALGAVGGALAATAEKALWSWADSTEQTILERIFIQLVRPGAQLDAGERAPDTRRVADRDQFSAVEQALIQRLATTRLVVSTRQPTGIHTVELAHEALLRAWPRLAAWVEANRDFRLWQEELRTALRAWENASHNPSRLLHPAQVEAAQEWTQQRRDEITADELAFIDAGRLASARRKRRRRIAAAAVATVCTLGSIAAGIAIDQHRSSVRQHQNALSRQLAAQAAALDGSQPDIAKQLRIAAYRTAPTTQAFGALSTGLPLPGTISTPGVDHVAISNHLIAVTADGRLRLWKRKDHAFISGLSTQGVTAATFSPDGGTLAAATIGGDVEIWNVSKPDHPVRDRRLTGTKKSIQAVAFSPDGRLLAAGGSDHGIGLWDVGSGGGAAPLARFDGGAGTIAGLAFSPDGHQVADANSDGSTGLWDVSHPAAPTLLARIDGDRPMRSVAFSPLGNVLAAAGVDGRVHLWSTRNARKPDSLTVLDKAGSPAKASVAFSPNGLFLAATGVNDTEPTQLWDVSTPAYPSPLPNLPDGSGNTDLAFSPDGSTLATLGKASGDLRSPNDQVQLRDMANPWMPTAVATVPLAGIVGYSSVEFSTDGKLLAAAGVGIGVGIWNVSDPQHKHRIWGGDIGASVSLSGRTLAVGAPGKITFWDLGDPSHPAQRGSISLPGTGGGTDYLEIRFSPDGHLLEARDAFLSKAWIIDTRTVTKPAVLAALTGTPGGSGTISANGSLLGMSDVLVKPKGTHRASIWDIRNPAKPRPLPDLAGRLGTVTAMDFAPNASVLAAGSANGAVTFWQVTVGGKPKRLTSTSGSGSVVAALRYSADGRFLVSVDVTGTVRMWDLSTATSPVLLGSYYQPDPSGLLLQGASITVGPPRLPREGRLAVTAGDISRTQIWTSDADLVVKRLCQTIGDTLTKEQWARYAPGADHSDPCRSAG